ncbi:hypothetical protein OIV83_006225 [Microbotryomycetes sp. JL201]|nr:hypothetical protein OIV83_006225 [Microbotryomycetes sp. JL201]
MDGPAAAHKHATGTEICHEMLTELYTPLTDQTWVYQDGLSLPDLLKHLIMATSDNIIDSSLPKHMDRASETFAHVATSLCAVRTVLVTTAAPSQDSGAELVRALTALKSHLEDTGGIQSAIPHDDPYRTLVGSLLISPLISLVVRRKAVPATPLTSQLQDAEVERRILDIVRDLISHNQPNKQQSRAALPANVIGAVLWESFDYHISSALLELAYRVCPAAQLDARSDPKHLYVKRMFGSTQFGDRASEFQTIFLSLKSHTFYERGPDLLLLIAQESVMKSQWFSIIELTYNGRPLKNEDDEDTLLWINGICLSATLTAAIQEESQELFEERFVVPLASIKSVVLLEAPEQSQGDIVVDFVLNEPPFFGLSQLDDPLVDSQGHVLHFVTTNSSTSLEKLRRTIQHRSKSTTASASRPDSTITSSGRDFAGRTLRRSSQSQPINASRPPNNVDTVSYQKMPLLKPSLSENEAGGLGKRTQSSVLAKNGQETLKLADISQAKTSGTAKKEVISAGQSRAPVTVRARETTRQLVARQFEAVKQRASEGRLLDQSSIDVLFKEWDDQSDLSSLPVSEEEDELETPIASMQNIEAGSTSHLQERRRSTRLLAAKTAPQSRESTPVASSDRKVEKSTLRPVAKRSDLQLKPETTHATTHADRRPATKARRPGMQPAGLGKPADKGETSSKTDPASSVGVKSKTRKRKRSDDTGSICSYNDVREAKASVRVAREMPIRVPSLPKRDLKRPKLIPIGGSKPSVGTQESSTQSSAVEPPGRTMTLTTMSKATTPQRKTYGRPRSRRAVMQQLSRKKKCDNLRVAAAAEVQATEDAEEANEARRKELGHAIKTPLAANTAPLAHSAVTTLESESTPHEETSASPAQVDASIQLDDGPPETIQKDEKYGETADVLKTRQLRTKAPMSGSLAATDTQKGKIQMQVEHTVPQAFSSLSSEPAWSARGSPGALGTNEARSQTGEHREIEDSGYFAASTDRSMCKSPGIEDRETPQRSQSSSEVVLYRPERVARQLDVSPLRINYLRPQQPLHREEKQSSQASSHARPLRSSFGQRDQGGANGRFKDTTEKRVPRERRHRWKSAVSQQTEKDDHLEDLRRCMYDAVDLIVVLILRPAP